MDRLTDRQMGMVKPIQFVMLIIYLCTLLYGINKQNIRYSSHKNTYTVICNMYPVNMSTHLLHLRVHFISVEEMRLVFCFSSSHIARSVKRSSTRSLNCSSNAVLYRLGTQALKPASCQLRVASCHHLTFTKRTFQFRFNTPSGVNGVFKYFDKQFSCTEV